VSLLDGAAKRELDILVTSGENLDDMVRCAGPAITRQWLMEQTLTWRHIAPTAPDTLPCQPFERADPFVLYTTPHVYVVGNQSEYASAMLVDKHAKTQTRLISSPSFTTTQIVVLLNLDTLETEPLRFEAAESIAIAATAAVVDEL